MQRLPSCAAARTPTTAAAATTTTTTTIAAARRLLSTRPHPRFEQVAVPTRSHRSTTLDIFKSASAASPVLIYLPPGPVIPRNEEHEERIISTLSSTSGATVVRINYRADALHQYPTPFHDALFGFDWVRENLLHHDFQRPHLSRLGVCGELVGASIATMLALTECQVGECRIGAAAVNNPISDWVFPDTLPVVASHELPEPVAPEETSFPAEDDLMSWWTQQDNVEANPQPEKKRRKKSTKAPPPTSWERYANNAILPTLTLTTERDVLFKKPEDYFDRFASPIHFFRSPHGHLIQPKDDDALASDQPDFPLDPETLMSINHFDAIEASSQPAEMPVLARCRAYARIYPPAASRLILPVWNITAGSQNPLLDQAAELAKMVRRSVARQSLKARTGRVRWQERSEKEEYEAMAREKVLYREVGHVGLWSQGESPTWQSQVEDVGIWMKDNLDHGSNNVSRL